MFVDGSIPLSDSLTAAVVEASDFDCAGFYQAIIDIHRDHKSLPEALTKSPYWELASRWCGDGNLIIEQLKDIGR